MSYKEVKINARIQTSNFSNKEFTEEEQKWITSVLKHNVNIVIEKSRQSNNGVPIIEIKVLANETHY